MSLKTIGLIAIPQSVGSSFDHGAFDSKTRRVFVAHTGRDSVEVIDHDAGRHVATLPEFPGAAGVVADDGTVLVTNRGAASLAWVDARSLETLGIFKISPRPNGVAIVSNKAWRLPPASETKPKAPRCSSSALTEANDIRSIFRVSRAGA